MAAGSPRFPSFQAFYATATQPMRPWQRPRSLPFARWPSALSSASRGPSKSTFPFPLPRESMAVHPVQTPACRVVWHRMEGKAAVWFAPHPVPRSLARRGLRLSRRRGNRPPNACPYRKAQRHNSRRLVVPPVSSSAMPNPAFVRTRFARRAPPRWAAKLQHVVAQDFIPIRGHLVSTSLRNINA